MIKLHLNDETIGHGQPGFFERQFSDNQTRQQRKFDWAYGVGLPVFCVAADPIVFRSSIGLEDPVLAGYKTFAYVLSFASIMVMTAWLLWGDRLGTLRSYFAGLFLVASAVSLTVGIALFPLSLIGSVVVIGLLGFTPLLSSFVFFRNAVLALDGAVDDYSKHEVFRATLLGALYAFVVPLVLHYQYR